MANSDLAKLYRGGAGLDAGSPQNNPAYLALVKKIESGDRGMQVDCPHCGSVALIRTSKKLSKLVREASCQCKNLACGHTFIVNVEAVRTISPAAFPDPLVAAQLPQWDQAKALHGDAAGDCGSG